MQRKRDFFAYEDLEARYERRPSLWVEPIGDSGEGAIHLVEIPTKYEIHDNIVAFWRPRQTLRAKGEYGYTYRLHWCSTVPGKSNLAAVIDSRSGAGSEEKSRLFVLDVAGERLAGVPASAKLRAEVTADHGKIQNTVAQPNPETGGWRMSFELVPESAKSAELRAQLMGDNGPLSEAWIYRWTA